MSYYPITGEITTHGGYHPLVAGTSTHGHLHAGFTQNAYGTVAYTLPPQATVAVPSPRQVPVVTPVVPVSGEITTHGGYHPVVTGTSQHGHLHTGFTANAYGKVYPSPSYTQFVAPPATSSQVIGEYTTHGGYHPAVTGTSQHGHLHTGFTTNRGIPPTTMYPSPMPMPYYYYPTSPYMTSGYSSHGHIHSGYPVGYPHF